MKRFVVGLIGFLFVFSAQANVEADTLRDEVLKDLKENVLHFWEKYAVDPSGGFYGMILNDGTPRPDEAKGVVLNARILWTFSTAYRLFGDENYKHLANRAQRYLIDHFIDKELGGVYWSLHADGTPLNTEKQTYGMAFAIYGLSEHFRATGSTESLMQSIDLYKVLETQVREFENDGYIESFTRNWQVPPKYGYDGTGLASKTMNTHIHLLEAYTSLYRVWRNEGLQKRLNTLINLVVDKIYNPETNHLKLFFNNQWESLEDIDSYGHDIETGWLLTEAAEVLEDKALLERIEPIAVNLTDAALKEGAHKFGGKIPNKAALKLPLRDGDTERDDEAYKNSFFVNANSTTAPQIVDRSVQPILDRSEVYSGCYARVSVNFYAFNSNGNRGIACGLGNIQKVRDGEPLGGKSSAADDFATDLDDDFLS